MQHRFGGFGRRFRGEDGSDILSADDEHPISSILKPDGSLSQQGISGEGLQREVAVHRHTELRSGGGYDFCWELTLYQHPGCRKVIPLGCSRSKKTGVASENPAPALARKIARAFHRMAQTGYDPREPPGGGGGGGARGLWWHRFVAPRLCGDGKLDLKILVRELKRHGYMGETSSLDGMRRRRR